MKNWMIYGANGYTGRMLVYEALARHMRPIIAGRNGEAIIKLFQETKLACRIFDLKKDNIASYLDGITWLINCAGPFSQTVQPLLAACCHTKTHYLDISGEIATFESIFQRDKAWKRAGIFVMPGVGFDVVPSDCLAAMLKRQLPDATHLRLAIQTHNVKPSHGTLRTAIDGLIRGGRVRRDGQLAKVRNGWKTSLIPFDSGQPQLCVSVPLADVASAWYSTRIPNIETYLNASSLEVRYLKMSQYLRPLLYVPPFAQAFKSTIIKKVPLANPRIKRQGKTIVWAEVANARGQALSVQAKTPEPYRLTVDATLKTLSELADSDTPPPAGAYTPSTALQPEFIFKLDSVQVDDIIPRRS